MPGHESGVHGQKATVEGVAQQGWDQHARRIGNIKHVLGHARSPSVATERPRRRDRQGRPGILRIGTGIVGQPWGQRQGRGRRGQMESAAPSGAGTQARAAGVAGDPGVRARCARSLSATRGSEIVAMKRSRPPQRWQANSVQSEGVLHERGAVRVARAPAEARRSLSYGGEVFRFRDWGRLSTDA